MPPALAGEDPGARALLKGVVSLLAAMAVGSWIGAGFTAAGVTLPAYIGAMLVAAALRNLDDVTGWIRLPHRLLDDLGNAALALFLAMALMTLRLWEIANLALPLAVILAVQVGADRRSSASADFRLMGRDYDAAVMSSGFCGFMLGTTANAMANMEVLVRSTAPRPGPTSSSRWSGPSSSTSRTRSSSRPSSISLDEGGSRRSHPDTGSALRAL